MNPIDTMPGVRKVLYILQWVANGLIGIGGVVFTATGTVPSWYVLTVAILAFVWTYTGITASTNVTTTPGPDPNARAFED